MGSSTRRSAISPTAFAAFERALTELEEHPFPLERGRTLLCLGTVRRRAQEKRSARERARAGASDLRRARRSPMGGKGRQS